MKCINPILRFTGILPLFLGAILGTTQLFGQTSIDTNTPAMATADVSYAPLLLLTNDDGKVVPLQNGQMLEVGRTYRLAAVPNPGYTFTNWTLVYAYTLTTVFVAGPGVLATNVTSTLSRVPDYITRRVIKFRMQAPEVIFDSPANTLTRTVGWEPEFVARKRHGTEASPPQK
jgi:hypothetical protein